jgi:methylglutaconyl-CoA hydratase
VTDETSIEVAQLNDHVWELCLSRPEKRNAITSAMAREITAVVRHLERESAARAIVIRGRGPVFCAGADLGEFEALTPGSASSSYQRGGGLLEVLEVIRDSSLPIVCAVHGAAIGGGLALAATAAICVATHGCRFELPEARLGLFPAPLIPFLVPRTGVSRAIGLALLAEAFDAERALNVGIVDEVVAEDALEERIGRIAELIGAREESTINAGMAIRRWLLDAQQSRTTAEVGRMVGAIFGRAE